jgi:tryptophanyl-tRNA synthetase
MTRVFSGIQPSGELHLGSYLGAIRNFVAWQSPEAVYCVVDLHAATVPENVAGLADRTLETFAGLIAAGLDPDVCTVFVQSQVPEHSRLAWLMECTVSFGELSRMTQFKDKSAQRDFVSAGLFTYPALQAADVLLYDTEVVPVGDDQRQHIELTRDAAERFNSRFGETLVVPRHEIPPAAARVMDLQDPTSKMSKSADTSAGCVLLFEDLDTVARKVRRAVTDSDNEVRYDIDAKPGVSNLLGILAAATDRKPDEVAGDYTQYGPLKTDAADAVVELLRPVQARRAEVLADPGELHRLVGLGAEKAAAVAGPVYERAHAAVGFLR